ncbi:MAG: sulfurtransferase TusA family protein [Candidatus Marinimicrobia bacterium]|nr:sulfurtransferase TusA family protein [Candidatus Neomarinimicrobiota bacterium]
MSIIKVNCINETCPVPLVETRKALRKAAEGDTIEVQGTHSSSKKEIPMAVESMGYELKSIEENDDYWTIKIQK